MKKPADRNKKDPSAAGRAAPGATPFARPRPQAPPKGRSPRRPDFTGFNTSRANHILVVETDPVIRGWLDKTLRGAGFHVSLAGNVNEAVARLSCRPGFAAIVCEYSMPDGTWPELNAVVRDRQGGVLPALLTSQGPLTPSPGQADFELLSRPFDGADLLGALNRLLRSPAEP